MAKVEADEIQGRHYAWERKFNSRFLATRSTPDVSHALQAMSFIILNWMFAASSVAIGAISPPLLIDSFEYASPSAAQAVWVAATYGQPAVYASQPVIPVTEAGVNCLSLPNAFTTTTVRGDFIRSGNLDLSPYSVISVKLKATCPSIFTTIGFKTTSGGWYLKVIYVTDQWRTYVIPTSSFEAQTSPPVSGWNTITQTKISCYNTSSDLPETVFASELQASDNLNLLPNSGFQVVTAGTMPDYWGPTILRLGAYHEQWVLDMDSWRARWGVDTTVAHGDTNSLRIVCSAETPSLPDLEAVSNYLTIPAGHSTFSVWVKSDQPNLAVTLKITGYTNTNPMNPYTASSGPIPIAAANVWQRCTFTINVADGLNYASCFISPIGTGTLWLDDVQLENSATATDWQPALIDANIPLTTLHKPSVPSISDADITPGSDTINVAIDDNGRFIVDSEPFLPIGVDWAGPPSYAIVQYLAHAGFNTIVLYLQAWMQTSAIISSLDSAKANGMKVVIRTDNAVPPAALQTWIETLNYHPAIIAWYPFDEPIGLPSENPLSQSWQDANAKYAIATSSDPHHRPVFINRYDDNFSSDWASDILCLDHYPIGVLDRNIADVGTRIHSLSQLASEVHKPVWNWLQSWGYHHYVSREPTSAEAECMAYLAIINGSRGYLYCGHLPRSLEQCKEIRLLTDEISVLTPVLSSTTTPPMVSVDSPSIQLLSKNSGANYVMGVNVTTSTVNANLTSSVADYGLATVMFEDRTVPVVKGEITDTFLPYQRHVYSYPGALVGQWTFDESAGPDAVDSSGNSHNGAWSATGLTPTMGLVGGALNFDGTNGSVVANNVAVNTTPGGANTIAFWMKWNGGNNQMPFGWNTWYDLFLANGSFGINTGQGNILGISSAGMAGQWVHVAVVFPNAVPSPSNTQIFINGIQQAVTNRMGVTTANRSATPGIVISGLGPSTSYKFGGTIDDLHIYNRALTPSEVASLATP